MLLHWTANASTSALHAAELLTRDRPVVDPQVSVALASPAAEFAREIADHNLPSERLFGHLLALSAQFGNNHELAKLALTKTIGAWRAEGLAGPLAGRIADLERAFDRAVPEVIGQLELRGQPLRQQWEARGPGLLAEVGRLVEPGLLVEEASVVFVYPAAGGGGAAHIPYNSVRFEAVLTNPLPQLPEVARLGWLLSQLNLDLPEYGEIIGRAAVELAGPWALIPPMLAAAQEVELARFDLPTLQLALEQWCSVEPEAAVPLANHLLMWWETYRASRPPFCVALGAAASLSQPLV